MGPLVGLNSLACAVHVVPPGKKAFPFHRHHVQDELFFVVSGEGEYRFGETTVPVRSGDLVAAPAGTQAHQLINTGSDDLRYLGISTEGAVDVVDYPDSKKIAVAAGGGPSKPLLTQLNTPKIGGICRHCDSGNRIYGT